MEKTYKELLEIDSLIAELFTKNPKLKEGKFAYGYKRFCDNNTNKIVDEINERVTDIRVENALTNKETGELVYDGQGPQRQYKYTKEGMLKMNKEVRKLNKEYEGKVITIKPYIVSEIPEMLDEEKKLLVGCLIEANKKK